ncbi:hypothetical protein B0H10DRAFT_1850543 [Mycena sp. CBHHK59/15]|nr:hypothetical protein B0H10DRAFT_1850543 [Mycena sp. CBHHK59/15]
MSTFTTESQVTHITDCLAWENVSASDFVLTLLERPSWQAHACTTSLVDNAAKIITAFSQNLPSQESTFAWARKSIQKRTSESIKLSAANNDWHFNALHASAAQLEDFRIEEMAAKMKALAPDLLHLLQLLLSGDKHVDLDGDQVMDGLGADGDAVFDESGGFADVLDAGKKEQRCEAIKTIKTAVMISIMMQSRNSKCNALESVFSIFLHSTNTPEKVIQALAHMGILISPSSISTAIHSLSAETAETLREMGQTLLVGYAYDNFDVNFPTIVPTIEKVADPLTHLTSGTFMYLQHGIPLPDLECSEELWAKSSLNPNLEPSTSTETHNLKEIHTEEDHPSGLTCRERFNAWKFKSDLFEHGGGEDADFKARLASLEGPESVEQIPLIKMRYAPARSMDINQSTHAGNIGAVENLLSQGGRCWTTSATS